VPPPHSVSVLTPLSPYLLGASTGCNKRVQQSSSFSFKCGCSRDFLALPALQRSLVAGCLIAATALGRARFVTVHHTCLGILE